MYDYSTCTTFRITKLKYSIIVSIIVTIKKFENNNIENNNIENDNNMNSNKNDKNSGNNKTNSMDYNNLNKKIIKEQDGIVLGVIDKSADSGRESLPENIQGVKMDKENKKSNFMMDKNMPYIDLENDMINLSLLPELRT